MNELKKQWNGANICQEKIEKFNESTITILEPGQVLGKYGIIGKLGHGGFSIVWLVVDLESKEKEIKALKVLKFGQVITKEECLVSILFSFSSVPFVPPLLEGLHLKSKSLNSNKSIVNYFQALRKTQNNMYAMKFYEAGGLTLLSGKMTRFGIFEPLGKDLGALINECDGRRRGFKTDVIRKLAKEILSALETLHDGSKSPGIIHTDIKPNNIATSISSIILRRQFQEIVKNDQKLDSLRMSVKQKTEFNVMAQRSKIDAWLNDVPKKVDGLSDFKFKLIDFGNAIVSLFLISSHLFTPSRVSSPHAETLNLTSRPNKHFLFHFPYHIYR